LPALHRNRTGPIPTASVIWLHGLGASGDDFAAIVPELDLTGCPSIRFVFPHAPSMPVTINGGYVMPAWYDIMGTPGQGAEDADRHPPVRRGRSRR
jgi:phospholipase/carboxylesterase